MVFLAGVTASSTAFPQAERPQEKILTTVAAVHELPSDKAALAIPIHLVATVTYYKADKGQLFIEDATGSTFIYMPDPAPVKQGDLIEVDGFSYPSFKTMVSKPKIRVVGQGAPLIARRSDFRALMSGAMDCDYVTIRGIVRTAGAKQDLTGIVAQLELLLPGGVVEASIEDDRGMDLPGLIGSEIELTGVAGGVFNGREQLIRTVLYATTDRDLKMLKRPKTKLTDLPLTAIDDVLPTRFVVDRSKRVRVRGTVTFYEPSDSVVIEHNGESLLGNTHDINPIALGSVVDVVGFADGRGYDPTLEGAEILPTGRFEPVNAKPIGYAEVVGGKFSDRLVTLKGKVLSEVHGNLSDSLVVLVDQHPVNVLMWTTNRPKIPDLAVGSIVNLTGICRIRMTGAWGNSILFQLDLRQSSDVVLVALPSWWTVAHLLYLMAGLLTASLLITGWAVVLRRRVSVQRERIERTVQVERQRSRLLEEINSITPLDSLLQDICSSIGRLVPDVQCTCELGEDEREPFVTARTTVSAPNLLYEAAITGATGVQVGVFRAENTVSRVLSVQELETLAVGASLSTLAVNQRRFYQELNYHSTHDPLTSLPNRRLSDMRLDEALQKAAELGHRVGVVYIDVNRFKQVNDKFGHKIGDLYLQAIAVRLSAVVRESDLLARIGGDEFLLTACELSSLEDAETYRRRLQSCFDETFSLDGVTISGSASLGVAIYPDHGVTASELQRHADLGMYFAKRSDRGEGGFGLHTPARVDGLRELKETA